MNKKLFLLAGLGVLLAGMKKSPPTSDRSGPDSDHGPGPTPGTATPDPIAGAIKGAVGTGLSAAASAALAAVKTALGGGTAAAGSGGALAHTTATTAHTTVGGATGGAKTGTAAGSGIAAAGAAVLNPASIAAIVVVVVVVIVVIIVVSIFAANVALKNAISMMSRNGAADLHKFELELFAKIREVLDTSGSFNQVDVYDARLAPSSMIGPLPPGIFENPTAQGTRATFVYRPGTNPKPEWMGADSPAVATLRMFKQIRAISLEYVNFRARLLDSMGPRFYPDIYRSGFSSTTIAGGFTTAPADWGGIDQLPLLDGQTLYSAAHPESLSFGRPSNAQYQAHGPREWFVARDATPDTAFLSSPYGAQLFKAARLKALCDVMQLFTMDPTVVGLWEDYARFVTGRLQLDSTMITFRAKTVAEPWNGWTFYTNSSFFGTTVAFDVWMIRVPSGDSRMFKRNAGVPLGDKRLGATWID